MLLVALAWAVPARANIVGSRHDFSEETWNPRGELCQPCHTPHHAQTDADSLQAPLWNHALPSSNFTPYAGASGTLNAVTGQPSGISKLCLGCHDGVTALENFGGVTNGTHFLSGGQYALGTDLSNDHPVSFVYDAALATTDGELADPSAPSGLGGSIEANLLFGTPGQKRLECASCHDPHKRDGIGKLLIKSNTGSALCLTCHLK